MVNSESRFSNQQLGVDEFPAQKPGTFMDIGYDEKKCTLILKTKLGLEPQQINFKSFWYINELISKDKKREHLDQEVFLSFYKLSDNLAPLPEFYQKFLVSTYKDVNNYDATDLVMFYFCLKQMGIKGYIFERNLNKKPLNLDKVDTSNKEDLNLIEDLSFLFRYLVLPDAANPTLLDLKNKKPSNIQIKNSIIKWQKDFSSKEIKKIDQRIDSKKDGQITEFEKIILYSHTKIQNIVTWPSFKKMIGGKS